MHKQHKQELNWLTFDLLSDVSELVHGVFLRCEGKCLQSLVPPILNLERVVGACQVHGKTISFVSEDPRVLIPPSDGLVTDAKQIGLMIQHADCQAALLYDPIHRVIGNIHSGWRGHVHNIYAEAIVKMRARYGTDPADLLVCISPSLGPGCAEFQHYVQELPESFWQFQIKPYYFDFWAIARMQFEACGVLPHHIEIASICTYSNPQDWYSYRRDKTQERNVTVIYKRD